METVVAKDKDVNKAEDKSPKYFVTVEGVEHPWSQSTITTEQIAALGGWATEGVIEIDNENVEHTLTAGEVIELKPGHGFSKKVRWKRGDNLFENRLSSELTHLLGHFTEAKQDGMWYLIPQYPLPEGWNQKFVDVAFRIQPGYPSTHHLMVFMCRQARVSMKRYQITIRKLFQTLRLLQAPGACFLGHQKNGVLATI